MLVAGCFNIWHSFPRKLEKSLRLIPELKQPGELQVWAHLVVTMQSKVSLHLSSQTGVFCMSIQVILAARLHVCEEVTVNQNIVLKRCACGLQSLAFQWTNRITSRSAWIRKRSKRVEWCFQASFNGLRPALEPHCDSTGAETGLPEPRARQRPHMSHAWLVET